MRASVITFEVIGIGIGIPANPQDRSLRPFEQATGAEHKGGTGLGLAIAKRLVESMAGEISVESEVRSRKSNHEIHETHERGTEGKPARP